MSKPRGMIAVNQILSTYAEQPATLADLLACMRTSATLRAVWKAARAEMGTAPPAQPLKWSDKPAATFGAPGLKWGGAEEPAASPAPPASAK